MKVGTFSALVALIIVFLAFFTWFPGELSFSELRSVDSNATPIVTFSEDKAIKGVEEKKQPSPLALPSLGYFESSLDLRDELLLKSLSESKLLKDLTLGFGSREKMNLFLNKAEDNGVEVLGAIRELSTVRVRIRNLAKASALMDSFKDEFSPQYNYRVRQPELPRAEILSGEKEFGAEAPSWMGAPDNRKGWGEGIKIAVLDSGVDASHPTLAGAEVSHVSLMEGTSSSAGHGTAVASIIAGDSEMQRGIAPAATILSVRVLDAEGEGDSFTVAKGIIEAVDRGADIINMSLGGDASSSVLEQAVAYAHSKGVMIVAAVGNEGRQGVAYPARYEGVVGVTSIDAKGRASEFSNYGDGVDIGAPGVGVYTAWSEEEIVSFSGTSTASAFVTGVLAAEMSRNPGVPKDQAIELLYEFANESERPGFDEYTGHGALNVGRIENRFDPYVADAAIVGYYFDPQDFGKAEVPFLVTVQNQGTLWLKNLELEVDYMGVSRKFTMSNLDPGEVKSEKLLLSASKGREGVRIESRLLVKDSEDLNQENNQRASKITLPAE